MSGFRLWCRLYHNCTTPEEQWPPVATDAVSPGNGTASWPGHGVQPRRMPVPKTNVVPLFRPSPRDQWLNELEDELRGLLESLPAHPGRLKLPPQARAWRAVARVLVTRELGANQFGRSYANAVWSTVEGYAEGRLSGATLRAVLRRVDLLASERPLRPVGETA